VPEIIPVSPVAGGKISLLLLKPSGYWVINYAVIAKLGLKSKLS
jgi:hypothetical protein